MKVGTKSLLFGCHQFILHPIFVYSAWINCYRELPNPKETICIIIHDWGYWGKPNMDGPEGELHPQWAAHVATKYLGGEYGILCLLHSRFAARAVMRPVSKLCLPDKIGVAKMPDWLWVILARFTGELYEYMGQSKYEINKLGPNGNSYRSPKMFKKAFNEIAKTWRDNPSLLNTGGM